MKSTLYGQSFYRYIIAISRDERLCKEFLAFSLAEPFRDRNLVAKHRFKILKATVFGVKNNFLRWFGVPESPILYHSVKDNQ